MSEEPEDTQPPALPDYIPVKNVTFKLVAGGASLKWKQGAVFKNGDFVKNDEDGSTTIVPNHGYASVTYTMFDPAAESNEDTSD